MTSEEVGEGECKQRTRIRSARARVVPVLRGVGVEVVFGLLCEGEGVGVLVFAGHG